MARMAAAHTTHGRFSAGGAAERAAWRGLRVLRVRSDVLSAATELREFLTPDAEKLLDLDPVALRAPAHVSRVGIAGVLTPTPSNSGRGGEGGGQMAGIPGSGARGQARPAMIPGTSARGQAQSAMTGRSAPLMANWREAERALARAEADALAPWKAAIAQARLAKRAAGAARARIAAAKSHRRQTKAIHLEKVAAGVGERGVEERAASEVPPVVSEVAEVVPPASALAAVEINPLYPELAFRAAGPRVRSTVPADGARAGTDSAPGEIDPGLRRDKPRPGAGAGS
jgi:hypothetical protein